MNASRLKIGIRIGVAFGLVVAAMASVSRLGRVNSWRGVAATPSGSQCLS